MITAKLKFHNYFLVFLLTSALVLLSSSVKASQNSDYFTLGQTAYFNNEFAAAEKYLNQFLDSNDNQDKEPYNLAQLYLGNIYFQQNKIIPATQQYQAIIERDPNNIKALNNYALLLLREIENKLSAFKQNTNNDNPQSIKRIEALEKSITEYLFQIETP